MEGGKGGGVPRTRRWEWRRCEVVAGARARAVSRTAVSAQASTAAYKIWSGWEVR